MVIVLWLLCLIRESFWFSLRLITGTESKCTSAVLEHEPLPALAWLPSLLWSSASYTSHSSDTSVQSILSFLANKIGLMPSQPSFQIRGAPPHHVFLSSLNKVQYCLTHFVYFFFCYCSVQQRQTSSNTRPNHFINYEFVSSHFPTAKEGSKKDFVRCVVLYSIWTYSITKRRILIFYKPINLFENLIFLWDGLLHTGNISACVTFNISLCCPTTPWARKSVIYSLLPYFPLDF